MPLKKSSVLFIINPKSGVHDKLSLQEVILTYLDTGKFNPDFQWTKYSGHGYKLAKKAAEDQIDIVVAVGGDGTIHNVATGLVGSQTILGIIPMGSGNGLARHLQIPKNITEAILTLNQLKVRYIDVGKINQKYFFNVAGFGFDGKIAKLFAKSKRRGLLQYANLVWREFRKSSAQKFTVEFENGTRITHDALMINMANASEFGNGFSISPLSNLHDGQLELVVTKKPRIAAFPSILKRAVDRTVHRSEYVSTYRFRKINILDASTEFHADGEPISLRMPISIEVLPNALAMVAGENYV